MSYPVLGLAVEDGPYHSALVDREHEARQVAHQEHGDGAHEDDGGGQAAPLVLADRGLGGHLGAGGTANNLAFFFATE